MNTTSQRWLHRYALLTAAVALLPIGLGALVTTLDAGMAFWDWPTSDGQNMFLYPWLRDLQLNRDKFVEHGHRLGGSLIGLFSIGLCAVTLKVESRRWARWLSVAVLLAVIGQGLLGGLRVIQDSRLSALVHGQFASVIFSTFGIIALVTGHRWHAVAREAPSAACRGTGLRFLALAAPLALLGQSVVGGFVRQFGLALHEHLAGAVVASLLTLAAIVAAWRTGHAWLRSIAIGLFSLLLLQLSLGAGAWITRFGFPPTGFVAVQQAPEQVVLRTAHAVAGMFVLLASVQLAVRVIRLRWLARTLASTERPLFELGTLSNFSLNSGDAVR